MIKPMAKITIGIGKPSRLQGS